MVAVEQAQVRERPILSWKARNRDRVNARRRELYAAAPERHRQKARTYRKAKAERVNAYNAAWSTKYRARLRSEMFGAYGHACECCGETEKRFLQLDHIHNDGARDRRQHKTGAKLLAWLKRHGWPKGRHRILCANCNHGRAINGGICPHVDHAAA